MPEYALNTIPLHPKPGLPASPEPLCRRGAGATVPGATIDQLAGQFLRQAPGHF